MNVGLCTTDAALELPEAVARLVAAAGHTPLAWPRAPEGVAVIDTPEALRADTALILIFTPTDRLRAGVRALRPGPAEHLVLVTRGLEPVTAARGSDIVLAESACLRVGALAGPLLAAEVRRGAPSAVVVAARFDEVPRRAQAALGSSACRVYASADLPGVEIAGAMVEVLAMALGLARGLGLGVGAEAMIVTRGIAEGARLSARIQGDPRTFSGLAGVGELVAAAGLPDHLGHARGLALARGETDPGAAALCDALLAHSRDLPITAAVAAIAHGQARAAEVVGRLMIRASGEEFRA